MTGIYITIAVLILCTAVLCVLAAKAKPIENKVENIYKQEYIDSRFYSNDSNDDMLFMQ